MTPQEKLKEIKKLYCHVQGVMKEFPHNANTLWLIARVEQLEKAMELSCNKFEPVSKNHSLVSEICIKLRSTLNTGPKPE
jgi:hypothetical protein